MNWFVSSYTIQYCGHLKKKLPIIGNCLQDPGRNKGDILIVAAYNGDRVLEGTVMKMTNLSRTSLPGQFTK